MEKRIYQIGVVLENNQYPEPLQAEASINYGGGLTLTGTVRKGLTEEEEEYILPSIIGVSYNDNVFRERADAFWNDFNVVISTKDTEIDASYTLDEKNRKIPVNVKDYMLANMMLNDSKVAKNSKLFGYKFYIIDVNLAKQKENDAFKELKNARKKVLELTTDETELGTIVLKNIIIAGFKSKYNLSSTDVDNLSRIDLEKLITKISEEQTELFEKVTKDTKLKQRALIARMLELSIIVKQGDVLFDNDTKLGTVLEFATVLKSDNSIFDMYLQRVKALTKHKIELEETTETK